MRRLAPATGLACLLAGCGAHAPRHVTLLRQPYLGLACRNAAARCDRLGLAVWLAHPARTVTARVDERTVSLQTGPGHGPYGRGLFWQGFLRDPNAQVLADAYPHLVRVDVRIVAADGTMLAAEGRTAVSAGYG